MTYLLVALGGGCGAVLRYALGQWIPAAKSGFPFATLGVNVLGCFLVGILYVCIVERSGFDHPLRPLFVIGFCGGFTTFSTFSLEAISLWEAGQYQTAAIYVVLSLVFCIVAALAAVTVTRAI